MCLPSQAPAEQLDINNSYGKKKKKPSDKTDACSTLHMYGREQVVEHAHTCLGAVVTNLGEVLLPFVTSQTAELCLA